MQEVYRSANPVRLSYIKDLLQTNAIESLVFDAHTGAIYQGIGDIMPRLMVADDEAARALEIIKGVGED